MAERFQVSLVTIRNDLDDLEKEGLRRNLFHRRRFNKSLRERIQQQRDEKPAAAIAALGYIKDATLSSSTLALAVLPWRGF